MSALSPRQMWLLDEACKPIREGFGHDFGTFLVGTAGEGQTYRDVDVRLIMADKRYTRLRRAVGKRGIALLGLVFGQYLTDRTGLPIDFQIQQQTAANTHHAGKRRNPLGLRTLESYEGDAPLIRVDIRDGSADQVAVAAKLAVSEEDHA